MNKFYDKLDCECCGCYAECSSYERPAGSPIKKETLWFCDFCASTHAITGTCYPGQHPNDKLLIDMSRMMNILLRKLKENEQL